LLVVERTDEGIEYEERFRTYHPGKSSQP